MEWPAAPRPAAAAASVPPAADAIARDQEPYTLLDIRKTPVPLKLTWARDAVYPAAICLRKELALIDLVKFTAKADFVIPERRLVCGFSCKDTLFGGRFSLNAPAKMIEYKKKFRLPNGSGLAVSAAVQRTGEGWWEFNRPVRDQFRPLLSAQLQFGDFGSGNVVYSGDGFSLKQRLPVPKAWIGLKYPKFELETYASLKVPQLTTRYSLQRDGLRFGTPVGFGEPEEQEALQLHISAANFVIRL